MFNSDFAVGQAQLLSTILGHLEEGIIACDAAGVIRHFNRAARDIHGLTGPELPGDHWGKAYQLYHSDGITPLLESATPLASALAGQSIKNEAIVIRLQTGEQRSVLVNGRPIRGPARETLGAVVTLRDVTELRQAYEQLQQSEKFLESLVENIPNMIFVKDAKELRFVRFNRAGEKLLGYSKQDLMGKNDFDFFPSQQAQHFVDKDREVLEHGELLDIPEERIATRTLGERILHTKKIPIKDNNGNALYLLGISEDITEHKMAEEQRIALMIEQSKRAEMEAVNEELRAERELREQFVTTLSHDLRSPITAARLTAELIANHTARDAKTTTLLNRIVFNMDRVDRMISNLLDANRLRAGEPIPLVRTNVHLVALFREVLDEFSALHGQRFQLSAGSEITGYWSQEGLRRILENLLTNAVKYGDSKAPITITLTREANVIVIAVHNYGPPISVAAQEYLFEIYKRCPIAERSKHKGWGIGLALVKGMVQTLGGSIAVRSNVDEGTTFTLRLPATN